MNGVADANQFLGDPSAANSDRSIANNMTNPNMVYTGSLNPFTAISNVGNGQAKFAPALTANPGVKGTTPAPAPQNTGQPAPGTGAPVTTNSTSSPAGLAAFLQASGLQLGNLQNDYNAVGPAQNSAVAGINNAYAPQMNTLDAQLAQGHSANQLAQQSLDTNRAMALRDLGNQLRGMYNNYQNQLGVSGAGNSSAADLIGQALTQEANSGRYDIGNQYGQQQTGINQNNANLQTNFQNQKDTLDAWKTDQLNKIATQYGQTRQDIENQMLGVGSDQARTALYMQDQAAAQQALSNMQNIVGTYGNAVQNLNSQFSNVQHPNADLSQYDNGYQVQQFSPVQLAGMSYSNNAAPTQTNSNAPVAANLQRNANQTPAGTLASLNQ
jgi:hypothetical protein